MLKLLANNRVNHGCFSRKIAIFLKTAFFRKTALFLEPVAKYFDTFSSDYYQRKLNTWVSSGATERRKTYDIRK